jgi:rfaE bifunctional protein nucleotidyltransferase chain/domain
MDRELASAPNSATNDKVKSAQELVEIRVQARTAAKTVVWTNGCFDLLHVGHVRSLAAARALGDVLIVGLNGDDSVRRLKGPGRPVLPAVERAEMLAALACVDYVTIFETLTPTEPLTLLQPDVHCKGVDYLPPHGKPIPESSVVEKYGGRIAFLPLFAGRSTSELVARIQHREVETKERRKR